MVLFQSSDLFAKFSQLDDDVLHYFQRALDAKVPTPKESTEIDVWIHSMGGDAHATYKLILELQHRSKSLRAVIPDSAKSAATLLSLGMDRIFMAAAADLGPLDAQVAHPGKDNVIVSALDVADSFSFLGEAAFDIALAGGAELLLGLGLPRIDVLNSVLQFSAQLLAPAAAKLDPHLIHQATNQLRVTEMYAQSVLANRRHQDVPMAPTASSALVKQLVKEYPAHGFVIHRDEARRLGLPIEDAEGHPRWNHMKELHRRFLTGQTSMLTIFADSDLDGNVKQNVSSSNEGDGGAEGAAGGGGTSAPSGGGEA